jgi:hypothetical protein
MIVRDYREVKAEPVVEEPGVTVRWSVSQLDEAPKDCCAGRMKG